MKAAISFSLVFMLTVSLTGCFRYQYLTLSSDLKQSRENEFVIENDTLQLKYKFNGEGGPVQVYAYNKLDKPIYIDWTKSAIIRDKKSESYVTGVSAISGVVNGGSYKVGNNYSLTSGSLSGTVFTDTEISFVPPKTFIETSKKLVNNQFIEISPSKQEKKELETSAGFVTTVKVAHFEEDNSPLKFRSFLTVAVNNDLSQSFHFDNRFWVSKSMESITTPNELKNRTGNLFYVSKLTGFGEVTLFLGIVTILGFGIAAKAHH
jgi:hypothetical protein